MSMYGAALANQGSPCLIKWGVKTVARGQRDEIVAQGGARSAHAGLRAEELIDRSVDGLDQREGWINNRGWN